MESTSHDDLRLVELHFDSLREMRSVLANHVSPEGLFLEGEISFEISELLRIRAVLPEDFVLFEAVGVVLWVDRLPQADGHGPLGTAVRWVTLDERGRTVVEDLVGGLQRQTGPRFELTPHVESNQQFPSDAFDATPAPREPGVPANPTRFKFTVRGGDEEDVHAPWDAGGGPPPEPVPTAPEAFDPDQMPSPDQVGAPVFEPEPGVDGAVQEELEWIEPDANPLPPGLSADATPVAEEGPIASPVKAPVLDEVDFPDEVPPTVEARRLEEAARALDQEASNEPVEDTDLTVPIPESKLPPAGEVLPPEEDWAPPVGAALPEVETTTPMDIRPSATPGQRELSGEPVDVASVFDGLDSEPDDDEVAPAGSPTVTPRERRSLVPLLLVALIVASAAAGGWYWWDLQGGRTGVAVIDDLLGVEAADGAAPETTVNVDPGLPDDEASDAMVMAVEPSPSVVPQDDLQETAPEATVAVERTTIPAPTPRPAPETTIASANTARRLADVRVETVDGGLDIVVVPMDGRLDPGRIRTEDLVDRRRVLIRVRDVVEGFRPYELPQSGGEIQRLRMGHHPDLSPPEQWVVADLDEFSTLVVHDVVADGAGVRVTLRSR
jgi:hypothetical protein